MPSKSSLVEVAGRKIQLVQGGHGPPILYLHSAAGETDWQPFHEKLSQNFQVLLPAHPGFAFSGGLDTILDIQDLAWHYIDLLQTLQLPPISIVGFSLGGWLAAEIAVLRPQLIKKLVLVASAGIRVPGIGSGDLFLDNFDRMRELLFYDSHSELARDFFPRSNQDERMLFWIRAREATARVAWNPYFHNPRLPQHLQRILAPTLLLWGEQDRVFPVPIAEYFAAHLPQAHLELLPHCGHMLPFEQPDEFARRCTEFLS